MNRTSLAFILTVVTVMLIVSVACGASPTATPIPPATPTRSAQATPTAVSTATTPTPVQGSGEFKFGVSLPLTGVGAPWGISTRNTFQIALEEINASGGIKVAGQTYTVKLIVYDDQYTPAGGTSNANKLVFSDKVQYMSVFGGGIAPAAQAITEPNKVLLFPGAYGKTILLKGNNYTFRTTSDSSQFSYVTYPWIKKNYPNVKNVAIMGENISAVVELMADDRARAASLGWKVVSDQLADAGTKDFAPLAAKAVAANPDLIIAEDSPASAALMLKSIYELGYKGLLATLTGVDVTTMLTIAPKEALEGLVAGVPDWASPTMPKAANEFYAKYMTKWGPPFNVIGSEQYPVLHLLKKAIEKAGTFDTDKVKAVMTSADFTFDTPYGPSKFGDCGGIYQMAHQAEVPLFISQVKDGKLVTIQQITPNWSELVK